MRRLLVVIALSLGLAPAAAAGTLPGLQTSTAPWLPEWTHLAARLKAIHVPALTAEGQVVHIHQHLDLYVNGKQIPLPAGIGIDQQQQFIAPVHTHDFSGIIHVESPSHRTFTLGTFFDIYGVRLTSRCIGGDCGTVRLWVNGKARAGDPRTLVLKSRQEIVLAVGRPPTSIYRDYAFPAGL